MKFTSKYEILARHNGAIRFGAVRRIRRISKRWSIARRLQKFHISLRCGHHVFVDVTQIRLMCSGHQRMYSADPINDSFRLKTIRRSTPIFSGFRCGSCKYDHRHKPWGGQLTQEYDENGTQLPFAKVAHATTDNIVRRRHVVNHRCLINTSKDDQYREPRETGPQRQRHRRHRRNDRESTSVSFWCLTDRQATRARARR